MQFFKFVAISFLLTSPVDAEQRFDFSDIMTVEEAQQLVAKEKLLDGIELHESKSKQRNIDALLGNAVKQAQAIQSKAVGLNINEQGEADRPSNTIMMFISRSMPRASFLDALKQAANASVPVYINGMFKDDENIMATMRRLEIIAKDLVIKPNVKFGPSWFEKYQIEKVPALVLDDGHKVIKVAGLTLPQFIEEKAADYENSNDLGAFGPTWGVEEESLIEQIKQRMALIDWEQKKKNAIKRYWSKQKPIQLPLATKSQTFFVDPTMKVKRDITNARGVTLAKAGQVGNPLKIINNAYLGLYIVDPNDSLQLDWLDRQAPTFNFKDQILITGIDPQRGWNQLSDLRKRYKRNIFLLDGQLVNRFSLKAVPAIVSIEDSHLKIREIAIKELDK